MSAGSRTRSAFLRLPHPTRRAILHRIGRYAPWEPGFDFTPPDLGPGFVTGPPDFVGIGAQKSGTTWWYDLIATHPGVCAPAGLHKERHLLDRYAARPFDDRAVAELHGWFPRRPGTVTGEWTPDYCTFAWAPDLLLRAAPDARLLVLVRDPVDRFASGLRHHAQRGTPLDGLVLADALERSSYASALERWLAVFPPDRVLVLQYERCVEETDACLGETFAFLGLTEYHPSEAERPPRPPLGDGNDLDDEVVGRLVGLLGPDVVRLAELVPGLDLARWPHFAHLATPSAQPSARAGASPA